MALCLVTGGAGFIGSHLVEGLIAHGHAVRVLDNFSTGLLTNLDKVRPQIELTRGDFADRPLLQGLLAGVDWLFHLAPPVRETNDPVDDTNARSALTTATLRLLDAARAARVRRVVFASTSYVYGHKNTGLLNEDVQPLPDTSYGFAKLAGEQHCLSATTLYGLETVRLRYAHVYGPRQCPTSDYARPLPLIVKSMLAGHPVVFGESEVGLHDYIYVDDAVHATLLAAEAPRVSGQVFNIASGRSWSAFDIVTLVNQILRLDHRGPSEFAPASGTSPQRLDITRAEAGLGFCPSVSMWQGLIWLIEYYADQGRLPLANKVIAAHGRKPPHFRMPRPATDKSGDVSPS